MGFNIAARGIRPGTGGQGMLDKPIFAVYLQSYA